MRSGTKRRVVAAIFVVLATGVACRGKPQIAFELGIPKDVALDTAWFEIAAYRDASCGALSPMLRNGVPDGSQVRVAFRKDDATTPTIGDIPRGSYAFAAVAKNEECAILATGCVEADVGSTSSVIVQMAAVDPTGACGAGASCQAGRCVPANDNADPSVGAGCSLELLGAGPLANPTAGAGTLVSAPAIEATTSGFVLVYREVDPNGTTAKITILPIDPAGGALPPARPSLADRCGTLTEYDGVGLVMNGTDGELMVARPPCGDKQGGIELLAFSSKPEITTQGASHLLPLTATNILVSAAHTAAYRAGSSVTTFVRDGQAHIASVSAAGVVTPFGTFGVPGGDKPGAWVAASDKVLALLSAGPPSTGVTPIPDAGDPDAGDEAGVPDSGTSPGEGTPGPTLRLQMLPVDTALDAIVAPDQPRPPIEFAGEWGAVAARGARVIVISDGSGPGRSVSYRWFDLNGTAPIDQNGISLEGSGKATTGDVAIHGDRLFVASLKPGAIALHAFNGASTTPRPAHQIFFAKEPRIPGINLVRDGRVAVAVTDSRVAVAWTTAKTLQANDSTGGYAVFACTQ